MFRTLAFAGLLLGVQVATQADVYRWVDGQGRVQYTDRWVPGSQLVKVDKNKTDAEAAAAQRIAEQGKLAASDTASANQKTQENAARTVRQDVAKTQEEQCKKATERYDKAIQARRIFKTAPDGTKEYVSDAEADAYRAEALLDKEAACAPKPK
jgi:hypothetical protein